MRLTEMNSLYFLYVLVVKTMEYRGAPDVRFIPFLVMTLLLHPLVNSVLDIFLIGARRTPLEEVGSNFYTRVDIWFYVALGVTTLIVWRILDARRFGLISQTYNLYGKLGFGLRYVIILISVILSVLFSYLRSQNPWLAIAVFVCVLVTTSLMLRAIGRKRYTN